MVVAPRGVGGPPLTAESIARALGGRRSGRGWICYCPAHENKRTPALSITERDGLILWHDFGGCSQEAVGAALRDRGLLPERERRVWTQQDYREHAIARDVASKAHYWGIAAAALAEEALEELEWFHAERAEMTRIVRICRAGGQQVVNEFRAWSHDQPALTAAMVRAGQASERRVQVAAAQALFAQEAHAF